MGRTTRTFAACAVLALTLLAAPAWSAPPTPAGVVWGGRHFTDGDDLSLWLSSRGADFADWLARHPHGRYLLEHAAPPPAAPVVASSRSRGVGAGTIAVLVVALALVAAAVVPSPLLAHAGRIRGLSAPAVRLGTAATGLGVLAGLGLTKLL